jgi:RNA polymerase sigma-70 factor (ECF subfamily)
MADERWFAEHFQTHAGRLRAVAYRMLGSGAEADDAVQEAWLRLHGVDTGDVENVGGWLTTVVARVCLDMLRARRSRAEAARAASEPREDALAPRPFDPEHERLLADSLGSALLIVLDALDPAERVAFVLHDMFAVPFEEIAEVLGRSPVASRQLASRARRRVQGTGSDLDGAADRAREQRVVNAFLAASRDGDFEALLAVLDPDIVVRADATAARMGASSELRGAPAVVKFLQGRAGGERAGAARLALVDGAVGAAWIPRGTPAIVVDFVIDGEKIVEINLVADRAAIARMRVVPLENAADE